MASGSNTTTGYESWPIIFSRVEADNNRFTLISNLTHYTFDHLDIRDVEALATHGLEVKLLDSDNDEKAYPGCQLTAIKITYKPKTQYQYYLNVTFGFAGEKDLKDEDLVGLKYEHQRGVMLFAVFKKAKDTTELKDEGAEDSK